MMRKLEPRSHISRGCGTRSSRRIFSFTFQPHFPHIRVLGPILQIILIHIAGLYFDLILYTFNRCVDFSALLTAEERKQGISISLITDYYYRIKEIDL